MRIVSFNINGLRAHLNQLDILINTLKPDVIGLQETKVHDDLFPIDIIKQYGYNVYYYGQKKYHGVALFSKRLPIAVTRGLSHNDNIFQTRIITAQIPTSIGAITIINGYFPQGESKYSNKFTLKKNFYSSLQNYIQKSYNNQSLLLIMGDMNITPTDLDIGIGEKNKKKWIQLGKCSFLPEERNWINNLMKWGLIDIYRKTYPNVKNKYSWFSYKSNGFQKNRGLRIDLILITQPLMNVHKNNDINYKIRSISPSSDHAPVWIDFNI